MDKLFSDERRALIIKELSENLRASVADLSKKLNVTEATIRSDLKYLENKNLIRRTHGGAIILEDMNELSFSNRRSQYTEEKQKIAVIAMDYIEDHDFLLLDASSTCLELAKLLKNSDFNLTVMTNGLFAAQELVESPSINVILIGGVLRNTNSIEGLMGSSMLDQVFPGKFFFSARALTKNGDLMDFDLYEVELKNLMFQKSTNRYCLLDHSKFDSSSVGRFGTLHETNILLTDKNVPNEFYDKFPNLLVKYPENSKE
ncbi:DeoR/GlpR family DNA-binding transcription regulator [Fodinisporobacter ferrooxydans]|uniref:DeoR/GlpR family DNA-binding transcription regulator n=1 Tax=Fodinisporobacter ferrooxydans TaxID=2901836 RepID=A0ABY4CRE6_9BACL|nr:DeoR/GlpR family DNA-binding transcription regulator [Alicyclobacillaceae bacterium MYW30-H2]